MCSRALLLARHGFPRRAQEIRTQYMPGGKSNPRLEWFDINGKPTLPIALVSKAVQNSSAGRTARLQASVNVVTPMTVDDPIVQKTVSVVVISSSAIWFTERSHAELVTQVRSQIEEHRDLW